MNFGELKKATRRAVHGSLAVPASYLDSTMGGVPKAVTVRHHTRTGVHGDLDGEYASVLEGINRLVFDRDLLVADGVTLRRGGLVTIPVYDNLVLELDQQEPDDGPVNTYWSVVQK